MNTAPANINNLIDRYLDDELTSSDATTLEAWITSDTQHAEEFLRSVAIHSSIRNQLSANHRLQVVDGEDLGVGGQQTDDVRVSDRDVPSSPHRFTLGQRHLAAGIAIGVAFVAMALAVTDQILLPERVVAKNEGSDRTPTEQVKQVESIARMVSAATAQWKGNVENPITGREQHIKAGMRLYAGQKLTLVSGLAEFKFFNGAEVVIEGPAQFEVQGKKQCGLTLGKLMARVMEKRSKGFIVETPVGCVEDLGTEFGVDVGRSGHTNVHVHRGKVELLLAGATSGYEISAGESVHVGTGGIESTTDGAAHFATMRTAAPWSPSFRDIPLGNLFDDAEGTKLAAAIESDKYGARANVGDLGVERIVLGGDHKGATQTIAPGVRVNLGPLGWFGTPPPGRRPPTNDTAAPGLLPIRTQGAVLKNRKGRIEQGIGLHANTFITFDVTAIRKAGNFTRAMPTRFVVARAGINDSVRTKGSVHLAVIVTGENGIVGAWVDGRKIDARLVDGVWRLRGKIPLPLRGGKRTVSFNLPLDSRARYLTLISAGDKSWVKNDQAVFSGARIVLTGVPKEERQ